MKTCKNGAKSLEEVFEEKIKIKQEKENTPKSKKLHMECDWGNK